MRFHGSLVALVTPFKNGELDTPTLADLIDWHLESGTNGLVPCGTTGEAATLSRDERAAVLRLCVEKCRGKIPVIAGTGTNDTRSTIELTKMAKEIGADATLLVSPYYNKPTQEGLYLHFKAVADAVDIPVILYNVPGRTAVTIAPETLARLAKVRNVVGVKEATGLIDQATATRALCDLPIFSGDDSATLPLMALGAVGVISVTGNIAPRDVALAVAAAAKGEWDDARRWHYRLFPLHRAMFLESNPIPVKTALAMCGRGTGELRLPLCALTSENAAKLRAALAAYGLCKG